MPVESGREFVEQKPKVLYHASFNREIGEFEPRAETVRDPEEGPVVFATPDRAGATRFIVPVRKDWAQQSTFNGVHVMIISDRQRFLEADHGGSIYSLSSDTFENDPLKTKHRAEWTSRVPVKPVGREDVESALEEMIARGVQVYFVDPGTYRRIRDSDDHGLSLLRATESENMKRGEHVKEL